MSQTEISTLSQVEVAQLSDEKLRERETRLFEVTHRDRQDLYQREIQYYACLAESERRKQERKRVEAFAQAEYFLVSQWLYPEDEANGAEWSDLDAHIAPLSPTLNAAVEAFIIVLEKTWIRLLIGEEEWSPVREVRYPAETREIFFCTEGKEQKLYRITFFDSFEEAQAFLEQYKTPKEG